jgi:hypothetical protein
MHLRFTIRDLLWLTLVVAILTTWWIDHCQIKGQLDASVSNAKSLSAELTQTKSTLENAKKVIYRDLRPMK